MRPFLALLILPFALSSCVTAVVAGATETGVSLAEERSVGSKVDDTVIYTDINNKFLQRSNNKVIWDVTINVRNGRVMLTGNVSTQAAAEEAVALTWKTKGVKEVINDIGVRSGTSFSDSANDMLVKKNLESRLLFTKEVWVINYSIDVVDGVAYLLGRTKDRGEFNRVMNVTRTTKGIKRVVNHLQILSEMEAMPAAASATGSSY